MGTGKNTLTSLVSLSYTHTHTHTHTVTALPPSFATCHIQQRGDGKVQKLFVSCAPHALYSAMYIIQHCYIVAVACCRFWSVIVWAIAIIIIGVNIFFIIDVVVSYLHSSFHK